MRRKTIKSRFDVPIRNQDGSISIRKASKKAQTGLGNVKVAVSRKKRLVAKIEAKFEIYEKKVVLHLPLHTISEANCFEHWTKKHARHKAQARVVAVFLKPLCDKIKLPCSIKLTRLAPKKMDALENLPMSLKYVVDAICAILTGDYRPGRADGDERISLSCDQVISPQYGVRVEFTF